MREETRICKICNVEHPIIEFTNKTNNETRRVCRLCINKQYRERNKLKSQDPEYRKMCSERSKEYSRKKRSNPEFREEMNRRERERRKNRTPEQKEKDRLKAKNIREENREEINRTKKEKRKQKKENGERVYGERHLISAKEWREKNPDKVKDYSKKYYEENLERIKERKLKYREVNKDKIRDYNFWWRQENKEKTGELSARRRARKRNATPEWLTREDYRQMRELYEEAQRLTKETGVEHAVDHIHPLQGINICGLHVPWNLQILTRSENSRKKNHLLDEYINPPRFENEGECP